MTTFLNDKQKIIDSLEGELAELREEVKRLEGTLIVENQDEKRVLLAMLEFHRAGEGVSIEPISDDVIAGRIRRRLEECI